MKLIPLGEVEKLIKNKMKELHELRKEPGILPKDAYTAMMVGVDEIREELSSIPTIDPIEEIEKMIEGIKDNLKKGTMSNLEFTDLIAQKYILEKLKEKLSSNP